MPKIGIQEIIDHSAILSSSIAGAEALHMLDLPPFVKLLAYGLIASSVISHILKLDHGSSDYNKSDDSKWVDNTPFMQ